MKKIFIKYWPVIILLILSFLIVWPTFLPGYFSHQDDLQVMRIFEMRKCFEDLQIPCRWVPDMGYGNGFPLFNYYSPLPYYIGGVLSYLFGFLGAAKLLFLIPLVLGGISMYFLAKELFGKVSGLAVAVLYMFAPYRAVDSYVRGAIAESFALSIIPLVFYFFLKLIRKSSRLNLIGASVSLGVFLLSHNIMVIIFLPVLILWIIYWQIKEKFSSLKIILTALLMGAGLSAFFTLPAFIEKSLVQTETLIRYELDFRSHFVAIKQLFFDYTWSYGSSGIGTIGEMSFQVGLPHLLLVILSIVTITLGLIFKNKRQGTPLEGLALRTKDTLVLGIGFFLFFLISVFMMHNKSAFIWEKIPLLAYAQFPWRFLSLTIFSASLVSGFFLSVFHGKYKIILSCLIILITVLLNWGFFKPQTFYHDLTEKEKLSGEFWSEQSRASIQDYLPKDVPLPREPAPLEPQIISGSAVVNRFINRSNSFEVEVDVAKAAKIQVPIFDFPSRRVEANGQRINYSKDNHLRRIEVELEPGTYFIRGSLQNTQVRVIANAITTTTIMTIILLLLNIPARTIFKDKKFKYAGFVVLILSVPATLALFVPGFFGAHDEMHIAWLHEMDKVVKIGQIPPRFVPDLSFGFGYPLFNFVYPLPYYLGEIFHLIGFNLVDSIKGVLLVSLVAGAYFMYKLLREFTNDWLSLAGTVIYTFNPYRATDVYIRGAVGEALEFVFMPLVALSVIKLTSVSGVSKFNWGWVGVGALSIAALVLTHEITAYMFVPFVGLLAILRILYTKNKLFSVVSLVFSATLGFLSSLYFWLPAILQSKLVKYDTVYNFAEHFPYYKQFFVPFWGYGASIPGVGDGMSFYLGTASILVVLLGLGSSVFFWRKFEKNHRLLIIWAVISMLTALFMMNIRSNFIWGNIPLIPYFQFPWRYLIITTFIIPIFIVMLEKIKYHQFLSVVLVVFTLFSSYQYFHPQDFLGRDDQFFLDRYIPVPAASPAYYTQGEEYLRLPKDTKYRPDANYPLAVGEDAEIINTSIINDLNYNFQVNSKHGGRLIVNKYLFPGWQARVNGQKVQLSYGQPFGQINIPLTNGQNFIEVYFAKILSNKILDIISLLAIVISLVLIASTKVLVLFRRNNIESR